MKKVKVELDQFSPFEEMAVGKRKELEASAEKIDFKTREVLFEVGSSPDKVYLLLSGGLKAIRKAPATRTYVAEFVSPGSLIGYVDSLAGVSRTEKVVSMQPSSALVWPASKFLEAAESSPSGTRALIKLLAKQIKAKEDWLEEQAIENLRTRLIRLIHRLGKDFGQKSKAGTLVNLRVTHQDLADHLGASRESVTVTISQLRKQKVLKLDVRRIIIPDMRALLKA